MDVDKMKEQLSRAFGNHKVILTCSCHNMGKKASEAFALLYPNEELPPIIKGRDRIYKFAKGMTPQNDHILAISKLSGKFAYYIEMEDNVIKKEINLLTGARTA